LIVGSGSSSRDSSSSISYFLIQACGSFLILISGIAITLSPTERLASLLLSVGLAIKLGLFPVHLWVVTVSHAIR